MRRAGRKTARTASLLYRPKHPLASLGERALRDSVGGDDGGSRKKYNRQIAINLAARLFVLYFVGFKFYSVTTDKVAPVVKFKSTSSRTKILRLDFLCSNLKSNLAKFANFGFKFYSPRPAS